MLEQPASQMTPISKSRFTVSPCIDDGARAVANRQSRTWPIQTGSHVNGTLRASQPLFDRASAGEDHDVLAATDLSGRGLGPPGSLLLRERWAVRAAVR